MAKFRGAILNCRICGASFKVPPVRAGTAKYCSRECSAIGRPEAKKRRVALQCAHCGKPYEVPQSHVNRRKYCSSQCKHGAATYLSALSERTSGEKNPRWSGGVVNHSDGYLYTRCAEHPFSANGYVLSHRLVMEEWLRENDPKSKYLIRLGNQLYLSPAYHVHHLDEDKQHNDIGNLQCMTPSDHGRHHAALKRLSK